MAGLTTKDRILGNYPPSNRPGLAGVPTKDAAMPGNVSAYNGAGVTPQVATQRIAMPAVPAKDATGATTAGQTANDVASGVAATTVGANNAASTTAGQTSPAVTAAPTNAEVNKQRNYEDMIAMLNNEQDKYKTTDPKEAEKLAKKKKREAIFAAIGDGISALSNLYFTTKGANNSYDPKASLSARNKERWDRIKREADDDRDARYNILTKKYELSKDAVTDERAKRALQTSDDRWDKEFGLRKEAQDTTNDIKKQIADAKAKQYESQQNKDAAMTAYYGAKIKALEDGASLDIALKKAKIAQSNASANASRKSSTSAEFAAYDSDGKVHYFKTDKAAEYFARQNGTWVDNVHKVKATQKSSTGRIKGTTETIQISGGHSEKPNPQPVKAKDYEHTKAVINSWK